MQSAKRKRNRKLYKERNIAKWRSDRTKSVAAWRVKNRAKQRAHNVLAYALKLGRLIRPTDCQNCGAPCKPHGHHADYKKPLEVTWLCTACHNHAHGK